MQFVFRSLDAFRHSGDAEAAGQPYDFLQDEPDASLILGGSVHQEIPIQFQLIDFQAPEYIQGRVAASEIIQRDPEAFFLKLQDSGVQFVYIFQSKPFQNFQSDKAGGNLVPVQQAGQVPTGAQQVGRG